METVRRSGLVHIYTGNGKGKTTAALGLGLRAVGHGLRVFLLQFMKGDPNYGELLALQEMDGFDTLQAGLPTFVRKGDPSADDLWHAARGLEKATEILRECHHDVVILDEIICAIDYGIFDVDQIMELIDLKPPHVELILTGRNAPPELVEIADLVTECHEVRHPFQEGILARKGIEY
jgi:cob(I)alamin adenosyltransferase